MATLLDEAGNALLDEAGNALLDEAGSPPPVVGNFPLVPLGVLVEILINGTWNDITDYVYQRNDIEITGGAQDQSTKPQSAQMTLTLNNRDGSFSQNYTNGQFYPYLQRSTQIRLSVDSQSINNTTYSGYRFWGAVTDWPLDSDVSGVDVYVDISAVGPFRYIKQGGGEGSALMRYFNTLTAQYAPVAYWPAEEDNQATMVGANLTSGTPMTVDGSPQWKTVSNFNGSSPIGVMNRSTWVGVTSAFGSSGDDIFETPGTYQWIASTTTVDCRVSDGGGGGTKGQEGSGGGTGGGGSALAREPSLAVTPGVTYQVIVGAGGEQGDWDAGGSPGQASQFQGDSVLVKNGSPPGGGGANGNTGGTAGTVGSNTDKYAGGAGGNDSGSFTQGAGGGGSAGISGAGGTGGNSSSGTPGSGGSAGSGGGGTGGKGGNNQNGLPGQLPGAGGGGGWADNSSRTLGGSGASGKVELIYTSSGGGTLPNANVFRFILFVPKHGGNNNKVLTRWLTSSTVFARVDVLYASGGGLYIKVYNSSSTLVFTSSTLSAGADNTTLMVSVELTTSGSSVNWKLTAIQPGIGNKKVGTVSGTQSSAAIGNASQCIVAPNGDITKTAMGHFSVQYALIDLTHVSAALDGHQSEMTVDRFIRLMAEEAYSSEPTFSEGADHWGFEGSTQSWAATNCALTSVSTALNPGYLTADTGDLGSGQVAYWNWPPEGVDSLEIVANGSGAVTATAPIGTSGQPVNAQDTCSVAIDVYTPTAISGLQGILNFYTASGAFISRLVTALDTPTLAGEIQTVKVTGVAPTSSAFLAPGVNSTGTLTNGTTFYIDNVRIGPRMGPQGRKRLQDLTDDIKNLEQSMLKESKKLWGLGFRTRISLINQTPAVTLDYAAGEIADVPQPVLDNLNTQNDITVKKHKGSKVQVVLTSGPQSTQAPPNGAGRFRKILKVVSEIDAQLSAMAAHMLTIGTAGNERYPTITVDMTRPEVASLFNAVPAAGPGDYIQLINLPFWYPTSTAKQLILGYTETINAFKWTIEWNCTPEAPFEITSTIRRW